MGGGSCLNIFLRGLSTILFIEIKQGIGAHSFLVSGHRPGGGRRDDGHTWGAAGEGNSDAGRQLATRATKPPSDCGYEWWPRARLAP